MNAVLKNCTICYGPASYVRIEPRPDLPIPEVFDFDNPIECAKLAFACMSNASGGFTIFKCKVQVDPERTCANLFGGGVHLYYEVPDLPKLTHEQLFERHSRLVLHTLGDVTTDGYGYGWKRARWHTPAEQAGASLPLS